MPDDWQMPYPVLCIASRSALDEAACDHACPSPGQARDRGMGSTVHRRGHREEASRSTPPMPAWSAFHTSAQASKPAHVRYLIRRLKRLMPHAKFVAGFWMLGEDRDKVEEWTQAVGADFGATSLAEATAIVVESSAKRTETARRRRHARKAGVLAIRPAAHRRRGRGESSGANGQSAKNEHCTARPIVSPVIPAAAVALKRDRAEPGFAARWPACRSRTVSVAPRLPG